MMCQYEALSYQTRIVKPLTVLDVLANRPTKCFIGLDNPSNAWAALSQIRDSAGICDLNTSFAGIRNIFPHSILNAM